MAKSKSSAAGSQRFHFISGLPRSGSTLTAALLRQNPRFHAGMSSPVASLFDGLIAQVSAGSELSSMVSQEQRARFLRGLFESYYHDINTPVVFDTNRAWTAQLPAVMQVFPDARVICLVRDVAWIMDSMERQFRQNAVRTHAPVQQSRRARPPSTRASEALAGANRLVGYPWHALREACYSDYADRIVIVDYDLLTRRPKDVLKLLYEFLGEEPFAHDLSNVDYDAPQFDAQLGLDGLHRVHKEVAPRPRRTILPPDLQEKYSKLAFWRDLPQSKAFRIVAQPTDGAGQIGEDQAAWGTAAPAKGLSR